MLEIKNLNYSYGKSQKPIFNDFSLNLECGNVYGLLGRNGVGKSTLLYLMSGLLIPKCGNMTFKGNEVRDRLPETLSDIFIVPEEFEMPKMLLSKYVKLYAPYYPKFNEVDMKRGLAMFGIDGDVNLGSLSMGQKKKVFISFALATNTSLLIMDEPTNGLDIPGKSQLRKFIASSVNDERTVVISTHQVLDVDKILDHVLILDNSEILINASVNEITDKLLFLESSNRELAESAIYAQSSLGGNSLVLENTDREDSILNLETLFNAALVERERIKELFNSKK